MGMISLTKDSIERTLGKEVPETLLVVAKNSVLGLEDDQIAQILGVELLEIQELKLSDEYRDVRLLVGAEYAKTLGEKDMSWDGIEQQALENLAKRVPLEKDTETLLRIAAVANKAQRRNQRGTGILDAGQMATRVPLTLTRRFTERLNNGTIREETQQISVIDGTAVNPKFDDIDSLLGVSARQSIPSKIRFTAGEPEVTLRDLEADFKR